MKEKKRVAVYMRCSVHTTDRYREMYTKLMGYIKSQPHYELVEMFYDNAPSKWSYYPPELHRMLEEAYRAKFDIVVVEKMETFSAYSQKRTDIERLLGRKGVKVITLYSAMREQRRAEKAKALLQFEMVEGALERGDCLTKEQFNMKCKEKAEEFIGYIDDSFVDILDGESDARCKKIIGIIVGDKVCCIPLTPRTLLALRESVEKLQRSIE